MSGRRLRISIVSPSFNQVPFVARAIESVLGQEGDFELDYHIVDGGSTDGTLDVIARYAGRLSWVSEPDQGQADAINKGLARAAGDVVGWLNTDDVLAPGALSRVAAAFRDHPRTEWVHGKCDIIDREDRVVRAWLTAYKDWRCRRYTYRRLLLENFLSQMTVFWRRRVHGEIGFLDTTLNMAFDYDLWLRLARRGDPVYLPERIASFRWYETSKSGASYRRQFEEDYRVTRRYAASDRLLVLRKLLRNIEIVAVYRLLAALRRPPASGRA